MNPMPKMPDSLSPPSVPSGLVDKLLTWVEDALAGIAGLAILAIMLIGVVQVVIRVIWNLPIPGYIDYVELMMTLAAFVAIGYAERFGAHIRMDFLPAHLSGSWQQSLELLLALLALLMAAFLTYATWFSFMRAFQLGDSTMDVQLKVWPGKLVLVVSLALLCLRLTLTAISFGRAISVRTND